jgi:hypothetical protein
MVEKQMKRYLILSLKAFPTYGDVSYTEDSLFGKYKYCEKSLIFSLVISFYSYIQKNLG